MRLFRGRRTLLLLICLCALLGWLASQARQGELAGEMGARRVLEAPLELLAGASSGAGGFVRDLFWREGLRERVAELEARVARLEREKEQLAEAALENQRLSELLGLRAQVPAASRAARVIAADASGALRSVVIDAGERDGVRKDAAVVATDGLVGRVLKVGATTAVVQVLVDAASGVGAMDERSRVQGVLSGTGGDDCRLKFVPNLEDVRPGDRIVASGLDGIYPKGTLVGVVSEVEPGPDAFKDIRVRPAVAVERLETVLVFVSPSAAGTAQARERLAEVVPTRAGVRKP